MSFYDLKANKIDGTEVSCKAVVKCTAEPTFIAYLAHLNIEYLSQFRNIHMSRFRDVNKYVNL